MPHETHSYLVCKGFEGYFETRLDNTMRDLNGRLKCESATFEHLLWQNENTVSHSKETIPTYE